MITTTTHLEEIITTLPGYDPYAQAGDCVFDGAAAQYVLDFFEQCLKHVKGPKAGQPLTLEEWQQAAIANLFGWKRPDGLRRYRKALWYVAKKNGKTTIAAGVVLTMLVPLLEPGAEIYSAAASREQAALVFQHAAGMVKKEPMLAEKLRIYGDKGGSVSRSIVNQKKMASYKCLSGDAHTADGVSPTCNVIDELHRHKTPELAEILERSTAARTEPITLGLTTADYDHPSLCNDWLRYAKLVRDNDGDPLQPGYDPTYLPIIYEAGLKDDWQDPAVWAKANPNLDVTKPSSFMEREARRAKDEPAALNDFLRFELNIVTTTVRQWLPMDAWDLCDGDVDPAEWREAKLQEHKGHTAHGGLDLGSVYDLTAFALIFSSGDDEYDLIPWFWVPTRTAEERQRKDGVPYPAWLRAGFMSPTEGGYTDFTTVQADIIELSKRFGIRDIGMDRAFQGDEMMIRLSQEGLTMVPFGQGWMSMAAPMKRFLWLVLNKKIHHGNNPVLRWMATGMAVESKQEDQTRPLKEASTTRIDGIVAGLMALGRAMMRENDESVYSGRGIITI
jgi:phage terminase large subunit-like protein